MNDDSNLEPKSGDHEADRCHSVRRDMQRTSTALGVVVFVVLILALVVVLLEGRSSGNLRRAEQAEADSSERLWNAYLSEARAIRVSGQAGRRERALDVIRNAAEFRSSTALRSEAIATLALSDLTQEQELLATPRDMIGRNIDDQLKYCAYGTTSSDVVVRTLPDGKNSFTLFAREIAPKFRGTLAAISFSPDATRLSTRFQDGRFVIWDIETHLPLRKLLSAAIPTATGVLSFSPDSRQVVFGDAASDGKLCTIDLAAGDKKTSPVVVGKRTFALRPESKEIAILTDVNAEFFDTATGTRLRVFSHASLANMLTFSKDGALMAVSCDDGDIYVWNIATSSKQILRGHSERSMSMGFSPDKRLLYSSSRDENTRVWDLAVGQTIATGEGTALSSSPDGHRLGFWRAWQGFGVWQVAHSSSFRLLACPKSDGPLFAPDLSRSGRWCVAPQTKGFRVWDLANNEKEFYAIVPQFYCARISPDEQTLYVCHQTGLDLWSLNPAAPGAKPVKSGNISLPDKLGARAIAVSEDGSAAAVELIDHRMVVIDLAKKNDPVILKERWRGINLKGPATPTGAGRFAISPTGEWVATGFGFGPDDVPRVWNARTGELAAKLNSETAVVQFSPDGRWLGLATTGKYSIWSVGDWKMEHEFSRAEASITHGALAFATDAKTIAATPSRQKVQLRSAFTDDVIAEFSGPTVQSINSVRLSRDGSTLVTSTASDMVEVWRLNNLRRDLAAINLDWGLEKRPVTISSAAHDSWASRNAGLLFGLAAFAVVAVLSLLTLRRHRIAIERFFAAEAEAARRHRELEVAKVELMHSQKMQALGTLAAGIAHDFNNLLSIIRMANKLIGREAKGNPEIQEQVADIEQAVLQGKHVVGSMLGYARSESNVSTGPTDVCAVVETTVSLLSKEFLGGLTLTLELNRDTPLVIISRGQLEQILLNLIVNASEAMQGQGRLKIVVQEAHLRPGTALELQPASAERYVKLVVIDSGPGISPEVRARLFEPFFTTKRAALKPGTGLGLSMVYAMARNDGLGLAVESEPGKGAAFSLFIPIAG